MYIYIHTYAYIHEHIHTYIHTWLAYLCVMSRVVVYPEPETFGGDEGYGSFSPVWWSFVFPPLSWLIITFVGRLGGWCPRGGILCIASLNDVAYLLVATQYSQNRSLPSSFGSNCYFKLSSYGEALGQVSFVPHHRRYFINQMNLSRGSNLPSLRGP